MPKSALIVLDLGALRYFDVAGFAVILKWAAEPAVRLCSRAKTVHALSDLLQAETVITIFQSREEALASLRGLETSRRRTALSPENRDDRVPSRRTA
jgi:anti-anti-sigma regulatory factor